MNNLMDKDQVVTVTPRDGEREPQLGVNRLLSAVFEPKSRILVGVAERYDGVPPNNIQGKLYLWLVDQNGMITKSDNNHVEIDTARRRSPRSVALVHVDKQPKLIVCTSIDAPYNSSGEESLPELWEANFLKGGKDLTGQLDTSKIVTPEVAYLFLSTWKNMLYVRCTNKRRFSTKSSIHVYVDLVYRSKITTPWGDDNDTVENVAFSDKYVFAHFREDKFTSICAFTWSPDTFTIGDMVFGPEVGCEHGTHFLLSSSVVVTNMFSRELLKQRRHVLGIYNVEDKSCKEIEHPWVLRNIRTIIQISERLWLILNGRGQIDELSIK